MCLFARAEFGVVDGADGVVLDDDTVAADATDTATDTNSTGVTIRCGVC